MNKKIIAFDSIPETTDAFHGNGKKIVHCHGVFDLIHLGHIKHLEAAKKFGDVLFLSITADQFVNKGPGRPIFNEQMRAESLAALEIVDFVTINNSETAVTAINAIKPDFYVKGQDYEHADDDFTGGILEEKKAVESNSGELVFTKEIQFSSSRLINQHIDRPSEEVTEYLEKTKRTIKFDDIKKRFEQITKYKVLVIGDIILDEYQFVKPMGKASKSATISAQIIESELYAGGALAVANHVADFVENVTLVTSYGLNNGHNYLDFIQGHLHKNVSLEAVSTPERPTVLKRRFVDRVFKQKLFEVTEIDDSPFDKASREQTINLIKDKSPENDIVLVADFGHGLIDQEVVKHITELDNFTAVNAQTNSANQGFNLITKYDNCDYFSIDFEEAKLAVHDKHGEINRVHKALIELTGASIGSITMGVRGSVVMLKDGANTHAPVLNTDVVDTIGAGDAFLSITALLAKNGASVEEIAFIGNAVGSLAVKILGNKSYVEKKSLLKYLKTLLS